MSIKSKKNKMEGYNNESEKKPGFMQVWGYMALLVTGLISALVVLKLYIG